ncbi:hypothetical protein [Hyphococcus sp.]|uniref:hypothetical protein n=1 Tax=Hyphococcus sp. TaxID=2038636 RepID=UPI002089D674|nr:MAG: hypothetical protein DHS20C04_12070 [Marinicaulis sp.]
MQKILEHPFGALAFLFGAIASIFVLQFPWFTFLATILAWTAMRAPKDLGFGHLLGIPSARTISDAAHEGLWAAVTLVFGVTFLFDGVASLALN